MPTKKDDGLTKYERYRLKDVEGYRAKKAELARTPEQRAHRTAYMREWREKNRARHNELARESHARHQARITVEQRELRRFKLYRLSPEDYAALLERQGGCCAICGNARKNGAALHIDHDHETGAVRGLLCPRCNGNLGWFERIGLARIERYLRGQ